MFGQTPGGLLSGLTPGVKHFLDASTAGALTTTAPVDQVKVGIAKASGVLFVDVDFVDVTVPTGTVTMFSSSTAPAGWLNCDGVEKLRTTFSNLFAVIGTTYGSTSGTTFTLPDMCGRSPLGEGTGSGLTARSLGDTPGEEDHQLTTSEMPSHSHSASVVSGAGTVFSTPGSSGTSGSTGASGSSAAHNTMHPSLVFNFIIKT